MSSSFRCVGPVAASLAALLAACSGANGGSGAGGAGASASTGVGAGLATSTSGGPTSSGATGTSSSGAGGSNNPPPPLGSTICSVFIEDRSASATPLADVFVTFAQPFKPGDVPAGATLLARTKDGAAVALQIDAKATHADGSLRHAVLTAKVPAVPGGGATELQLVSAKPDAPKAPVAAGAVLATSFDTSVSAALGGTTYAASARALLAADSTHTWISGPLATEWILDAPLASGNTEHPHLTARFDVRAYAGVATIVTGVTVENDWAFEPGPQNFIYDVSIATDAGPTLSIPGLVHSTQARWRRSVVWGKGQDVGVRHDPTYLVATGAVPSFDLAVKASDAALDAADAAIAKDASNPMGVGLCEPYMPTTGGRGDIGPLPSWAALWAISGDARAERATLGTADKAGSWSIHYRDKKTGLPVSLDDHPYMTLLGSPSDACNPATNQCDNFPDCAGDCSSPYTADSAHQPSLAYLPYLLTGERYYLEELQFWANWNMLQANPGYRDHEKGLVHWDQVRGQGWSMRTLGQAAFITPDADPLKKYFGDRLAWNLAWYDGHFGKNANANALHYDDDHAVGDDGTMAPWMDDFFTWSIGYLVELGYQDAVPVRDWKVQYAISRMTDPAYCWIFASIYHMVVVDPATQAPLATWADVYQASLTAGNDAASIPLACGGPEMAAALNLQAGEMVGYSSSAEGYPSNLQPALAIAAESGVAGGKAAWGVFQSRSVKPDSSSEPQFAIVPR